MAEAWQKASHQVDQITCANDDNSLIGVDGMMLNFRESSSKMYAVRMCVPVYCAEAREQRRMIVMYFPVFLSKHERLLKPCLQEKEGGGCGVAEPGGLQRDAGDSGIWMA